MRECTKNPPTERGWYWFRNDVLPLHPVKVSQSVVYMAEGKGCEWLAFGIYHGSGDTESYIGQWWPEAIKPPTIPPIDQENKR